MNELQFHRNALKEISGPFVKDINVGQCYDLEGVLFMVTEVNRYRGEIKLRATELWDLDGDPNKG